MSVDCHTFENLTLLYLAGLLDGREGTDFESHLACGCVSCTDAMECARGEAALMWLGVDNIEPPSSVKRRLMARVRRTTRLSAMQRQGRWPGVMLGKARVGPTALAMAAMIALVMGILAVQQWHRAEKLSGDLMTTRAGEASASVAMAGKMQSLQALLGSSSLTIVPLRGKGSAGHLWGRLLWDRQRAVCYLFSPGLRPTPVGSVYRLWFLSTDGQVVMSEPFRVSSEGTSAVAVSLADHTVSRTA